MHRVKAHDVRSFHPGQVAALRFCFLRRTLTLSRRPLIPRGADAVRLLDLRGRGAPIASCTCRVKRLYVNGAPLTLD